MSLEGEIFNALKGLVGERVFPDVAPAGTVVPYATFQQVGGAAYNYVEGGPIGLRNARVQISVWAGSRVQASAIGNQAEDILRSLAVLQPTVLGAGTSVFEPDTGLFGRMQDFNFSH